MKVLITGGELFNKGAQSMTFSVVSEIRKRFPDAQISLLSATDCRRSDDEKSQYRFSILPWDLRMKLRRIPVFGKMLKNKYFSVQQEVQMWQTVRQADLVVDVSGFCLSSQFSKIKALDYLSNIWLFKRFGIPVVLFPQSFGPFEYSGPGSTLIKSQITSLLKYPKVIFAREPEGMEQLAVLGVTSNVKLSLDTVLQTSSLTLENIFSQNTEVSGPVIEDGAVGIVPNQKIFVKNSNNALMETYKHVIEKLLGANKTVYLLRHSFEDKSIIAAIKAEFASDGRVIALDEDYSSIQLTQIIKKFEFLIASRYHAVVHAYKCLVPCIVLGWAVKYQTLTSKFAQLSFCFDVRDVLKDAEILSSVNHMLEHHKTESKKITETLGGMNVGQLFDEVFQGD